MRKFISNDFISRIFNQPNLNKEKTLTPEQKAKDLGVPLIPKKLPIDQEQNPVVAVCGECGLEIRKTTMYSCSRTNCPVQIKIYSNE